ncbi:hypothetical protein [Saccharopolyspora elongata]|uniref:Uncharacterized protein n=1 Tax=Saccharopolyspora elongata TaxID=2530387 RepID=A0A4R4YHJ1_9PSEU|nr:hypothetical protein [Saccharopolyspora elongata]TDD44273.1 hypothetical protein E1288_24440 [Saccharopolyspora elongata]
MKFGKAVAVVAGGTVAAGALFIGVSLAMEQTSTSRSTVVKVELTPTELRCPPTEPPNATAGKPSVLMRLCGVPMNSEGIRRLVVPPSEGG